MTEPNNFKSLLTEVKTVTVISPRLNIAYIMPYRLRNHWEIM